MSRHSDSLTQFSHLIVQIKLVVLEIVSLIVFLAVVYAAVKCELGFSGQTTRFNNGTKSILLPCYIQSVAWEVEFTDEFEAWWHTLSESEQGKVDARVNLLMERGPNLGFPFSSQVRTSRFPEMRELRAQAGGDPLRMLYAFDPRRTAILLVAWDKTGDDRWYETKVPMADRLFERHLSVIGKERGKHG
jgi:hypothetical protein